jgi:hypothetical protein
MQKASCAFFFAKKISALASACATSSAESLRLIESRCEHKNSSTSIRLDLNRATKAFLHFCLAHFKYRSDATISYQFSSRSGISEASDVFSHSDAATRVKLSDLH